MATNDTTASMGHQTRMAMDSTAIDGLSQAIQFESESISNNKEHINFAGIIGSRSMPKERVRDGVQRIGGRIVINGPSPAELDFLLPYILGATESTDEFALAETLPTFVLLVKRVAREFTYSGCKIARARFSGSTGTPLRLELDVLAATSADAAADTATLPSLDTDTMYVFSDCHTDASGLFTVNSEDRDPTNVEIVIDNLLNADRFNNSVTRTDIPSGGRDVLVNFDVPYESLNEDLHDFAVAGDGAAVIKFTNGNQSLNFAFGNLKWPNQDPTAGSKAGELILPIRARAYKSGSDDELVVTHDSTA